jgi:hypothetical protein
MSYHRLIPLVEILAINSSPLRISLHLPPLPLSMHAKHCRGHRCIDILFVETMEVFTFPHIGIANPLGPMFLGPRVA